MNNSVKEEWIDGKIMISLRPQCNHVVVEKELYFELRKYFNNKCAVAQAKYYV